MFIQEVDEHIIRVKGTVAILRVPGLDILLQSILIDKSKGVKARMIDKECDGSLSFGGLAKMTVEMSFCIYFVQGNVFVTFTASCLIIQQFELMVMFKETL
jgi:hypothetical protein